MDENEKKLQDMKPLMIEKFPLTLEEIFLEEMEGSDYDFCILTPDDYGLFEVGGFYADLRDALGTDIDVVCEESLRDDFSREVLRDRRLLYEA